MRHALYDRRASDCEPTSRTLGKSHQVGYQPMLYVEDYDPCPNKKGADCDCFNPDGTWRDKSKDKVTSALPKPDSRSKTYQKCSDDCPECPIEIHSRTVYPKCEAMLPGYGGHVPGIQVCKFGKTFGRETREALQKVYSTPLLN